MSRDKLEMEAETAHGCVQGALDDIADLERFWPPSKRGSNAQRALDRLKARLTCANDCLRDGLKPERTNHDRP